MISGKSFSELCRWVVDPRYPTRDVFYYGRANSGDWVFVNGDFLHSLTLSLPVVSIKKFVFIVHNTDRSFGEPELRLLAPVLAYTPNPYINFCWQTPCSTVYPCRPPPVDQASLNILNNRNCVPLSP